MGGGTPCPQALIWDLSPLAQQQADISTPGTQGTAGSSQARAGADTTGPAAAAGGGSGAAAGAAAAAAAASTVNLDPILAYNSGAEINQLQWSIAQPDWVAVSFANKTQILRV